MEFLTRSRNVSDSIKQRLENIYRSVPEEKVISSGNILFRIVEAIYMCTEDDAISVYYFNLFEKALNSETRGLIHPSHLELLKFVTKDEIDILRKIKQKTYEFIETADLKNRKFYNWQSKQNEFPVGELNEPDKFELYIHNLQDRLKLMFWPVYKQDGVWENGVQTGLVKRSRMVLTVSGQHFLKSICKNEN